MLADGKHVGSGRAEGDISTMEAVEHFRSENGKPGGRMTAARHGPLRCSGSCFILSTRPFFLWFRRAPRLCPVPSEIILSLQFFGFCFVYSPLRV